MPGVTGGSSHLALLVAYDSLAGQLWLLAAASVFALGVWLLKRTAGFVLLVVAVVAVHVAGVVLLPIYALAASAALGVGGFLYPDLPLAEQVEQRQQAFRHAFSSYLDLVTILLAGGAGTAPASNSPSPQRPTRCGPAKQRSLKRRPSSRPKR